MSASMRRPMTLAAFLAWEEGQEVRYEFDGIQPVAMTGGTVAHDRITFNLHKSLDARLAAGRCRSFGPNVKIMAAERVRYPDAIVTCTGQAADATMITLPVVVFEVLSAGTLRTDRIDKVREYWQAESICRYIILEPDGAGATVFTRTNDAWRAETVSGDVVLDLPEVGIVLPLAECYAGAPWSGAPD